MGGMKVIHIKDALRLLETHRPCNLKVWKMSTGDILEYKGATCVGSYWRGGRHRVQLPNSGLIREFRDITLFEINGMEIFL